MGMDVVRSVLDRLKGTVQVSSTKGKGTSFLLRVPLTLASIQTLLFRVGGRLFAVPLSSVIEIARATPEQIQRIDQREVLRLRDQILSIVRLNSISRIHAIEDERPGKKNAILSSSSVLPRSASAFWSTAWLARKNWSSRLFRAIWFPAIL